MRRTVLGVLTLILLASSAIFAAQAADTGRLKLEAEGVDITLKSGENAVALNAKDSDVAAAPGKYTPASIVLMRKQITGTNGTKVESTWKLQSAGPWGKLADLTVESGKTTVLKLGQPLTLSVKPQPAAGNVVFSFAVVGASGESYRPLALKDDKPVDSPPKMTILDEAGKVLESGIFKFG
jgi:hypothetical protein